MWSSLVRTVVLACLLAPSAGCSREGVELDTSFLSPPSSTAEARVPLALDCDDLPPLSPEEAARPPLSPPRLERSTRGGKEPAWSALPDVTLADAVADKVDEIDEAYFRRTGKHLTVTSGTRDAARQAKAMYKMLRLGGDPMRLYRNKEAAREIKQAYERARAKGKAPDDVVEAMYDVLRAQITRGVYISAHLRAGAVDVRSRDMSSRDKKAFVAAVNEAKGVTLLEESAPPHWHLQVD
ncbi:hypothetical protein [Polyangium spumosum]|uniref:Uncharacterized protein n=1 Tax=Polyangium spumosum TaxID=889282 RepID=A0A6N7PZD8_9BACT|nr:hypothetical protein [Polyangium spumosum]MRG97458.1 hypothetical protein [Polyangium spumosum]